MGAVKLGDTRMVRYKNVNVYLSSLFIIVRIYKGVFQVISVGLKTEIWRKNIFNTSRIGSSS